MSTLDKAIKEVKEMRPSDRDVGRDEGIAGYCEAIDDVLRMLELLAKEDP